MWGWEYFHSNIANLESLLSFIPTTYCHVYINESSQSLHDLKIFKVMHSFPVLYPIPNAALR